jgi:membrane-associated phospholipid phosphatase
MAKDVTSVKNPINGWQRTIDATGAIAPQATRRYRTSVFLAYMILAVIVFFILAVVAHTVAYFTFDVTITHAVQTFNAGWFDSLMYALSWIGFAPQEWVISLAMVLFLYASGLKWETVVAFVSLVGISILGPAIKLVVDRPRPSADLVNVINQLNGYSFPSGHVLYFTTFFGFSLFLSYTLLKPSWWRTALFITLGGMVALIGLSRIYEGQHWASDVIGAFGLAYRFLSTGGANRAFSLINLSQRKRPPDTYRGFR